MICQVEDCPNGATHHLEADLDGEFMFGAYHTTVRVGTRTVHVCDEHTDVSQAALCHYMVCRDEWNDDYSERTIRDLKRLDRIKLDGYADDQGSKRAVPA